jgi:hypothetical protein
VRRSEIAAVTPKNEPLTAHTLIRRELRHLGLHRVVVERVREAIPDVDVAWSEGGWLIPIPTRRRGQWNRGIWQHAGNVRRHFQPIGAGADVSR